MAKPLDQVREVIRMKHYSIRTERVYVDWIKRYILFSLDAWHHPPGHNFATIQVSMKDT